MSLNKPQGLKYLIIALFLLPWPCSFVNAQSLKYSSNLIQGKDWNFIENKGQLDESTPCPRQRGTAINNDIRYYGRQGGVYLYCKPGMIGFVFTKAENSPEQISEATGRPSGFPLSGKPACADRGAGGLDPSKRRIPLPTKFTTCRADLILLHSNLSAQILASGQQEYYENFYTSGNVDSGITNVHTFKTVTYRNIYPHIDLILHSREEGMKYEFIVHPGGKASDIQMQWSGLENITAVKNGGLKYANELGYFTESKPFCYQGDNIIQSRFRKNNAIISFEIRKYNEQKTLVIDPTLEWGTYYGSSGLEIGYGVVNDAAGNVYISGTKEITSGPNGNNYIAKFSKYGAEIWVLYYGSPNIYEYSSTLAIDGSGNIYMSGNTQSCPGTATSGAYQTSCGGGSDAFLSKFNSSGTMIWGTYFGGAGNDRATGVCTDKTGNVYITGITSSTYGIATAGSYKSYFNGGAGSDAFVAKFDANGNIKWSTYYGGSDDDQANGIASDPSGGIYITGTTKSDSGIATHAAFLTSRAGQYDMFVAKFGNSGTIHWATYYGGEYNDEAMGIAVDRSANIYIGGYAQSHKDIATSGAFLTSHYAWDYSNDGCLIKFDSAGTLKWGTYYGNAGNEEVNNITCDDSDNIYLAGFATNNAAVATPDAYSVSCYNYGGAFFAKFAGSCKRLYGTYYASGTANGISVDKLFNVYMTGYTSSSSGIATPGAYQTSLSGFKNAFLVKFKFFANNDAGIASIQKPKTFCPGNYPVTVKLKNYGKNDLTDVEVHLAINFISQKIYYWTGDLKPDSTVIINLDSFNFKSGKDTIQAWTLYPNGKQDSIMSNDSSIVIDTVYPVPVAYIRTNHNVCQRIAFSLGNLPVKGNDYLWSSNPAGFSSTLSNPILTLAQVSTTLYILKEINSNGCTTIDSAKITVHPPPIAYAGINKTICSGKFDSLGKSPDSGCFYSWVSIPAGFSSLAANPVVNPTYGTVYILSVITALGCTNSDSVNIQVNPSPIANAGNNATICQGKPVHIGALIDSRNSFSWKYYPPGPPLKSSELWVEPDTSTRYVLTVTNGYGCSNSDSVNITVNKLPLARAGHDTTICDGYYDTLGTAMIKGVQYFWYNTDQSFISKLANPVINPSQNTTYYLYATSQQGCIKSDSIIITVLPSPVSINAGKSDTICSGTKVSLGSPPVSGINYSWTSVPAGFSSSSSGPNIHPSYTATYILKETANKGCSKTDSVTITVNPSPAANTGSVAHVCEGTETLIGSAKVTGDQYLWASVPPGFISSSPSTYVKPSATTIYILTETNPEGCSKTDSVTVNVIPAPDADAGVSQTVCAGTQVFIGAAPEYLDTYLWSSLPAGFDSTSSNPTDAPDTTTTYTVTTFGWSGCSKKASVTITVNPLPDVRWKSAINCESVSFLPQKSPDMPFLWYFGDGDSDQIDKAPVHFYKSPGQYTVKLVAATLTGCRAEYDSAMNINCLNTTLDFGFYPNPFHSSATLQYNLNEKSKVNIVLFDAIGRQVSVIEDNTQDAGQYSVDINAQKFPLASGVYFLIFKSDEGNVRLKVVSL